MSVQSWSEIVRDLQANWPIYASMPFVAAAVGFGTKIVAIKMMFRPRTYRGFKPFGWQGIIPRRAPQMAEVLCDTLTGRLITSAEIVERLDGKRISKLLDRPLRPLLDEMVRDTAETYQPVVWNSLPPFAQAAVVQRAQEAGPKVVEGLVEDIRDHIDEVFDLKDMVTRVLREEADVLESMFLDVGRREFAFIRNSGAFFGFGIGLVQAVVWAIFHNPLIIPVFGLFTGWFTDWVALRLIFEPKEPTKYLGVVTWQGLFLKHRIPVSKEYGELIATNVLTADKLINEVFTGPKRANLLPYLEKRVEKALRKQTAGLSELLEMKVGGVNLSGISVGSVSLGSIFGAANLSVPAIGEENIARMRDDFSATLMDRLPEVLPAIEAYADEAMLIKPTMVDRMVSMTSTEFEGVLRPAFQQDEKTLIAVGAILGFLVGELQVFIVEHLSTHVK